MAWTPRGGANGASPFIVGCREEASNVPRGRDSPPAVRTANGGYSSSTGAAAGTTAGVLAVVGGAPYHFGIRNRKLMITTMISISE